MQWEREKERAESWGGLLVDEGERGGGPAARRSGELDTAASGSDATVSDRDDGNFAITPLAPFLLLCFYFFK